jgi:hypothetical protein
MIRNGTIPISGVLLSQLRAMAKLDNLGCAENALELIVSDALAKRPEIADLVKRKADAAKQAESEWRAAWKIEEDQLP